MKTLWISAIVSLVQLLAGGELWRLVADAVEAQNDRDISGADKRGAVLESVQQFSVTGATWLINLAIETAVARLKVRAI